MEQDTGGLQPLQQGGGGLQDALLVLGYRDDHHLRRGDPGRQDQAIVVAVGHDDAADHPGGNAPAGLVGVMGLVVLPVKVMSKALAKPSPK